MVKKKLDKLQEAYDGLVQSDEGLQVLLNDLMSRASDRERIAITFDRQKDGLSLIEIIFTKSKLISITKHKANVPSTTKAMANKIIEQEIMKAKKLPVEKD